MGWRSSGKRFSGGTDQHIYSMMLRDSFHLINLRLAVVYMCGSSDVGVLYHS